MRVVRVLPGRGGVVWLFWPCRLRRRGIGLEFEMRAVCIYLIGIPLVLFTYGDVEVVRR